jgi:hypothetical protein
MATPEKSKFSDNPRIRRLVENHLVFGPISKYFDVGWMLIPLGMVGLVCALLFPPKFILAKIMSWYLPVMSVVAGIFVLHKPNRYEHAFYGWIGTKGGMGICALMFIVVGAPVSALRGKSDALPNLLLGLIWLPWLEFLPTLERKQKLITICRLIASVPVVYMGCQSRHWHW